MTEHEFEAEVALVREQIACTDRYKRARDEDALALAVVSLIVHILCLAHVLVRS